MNTQQATADAEFIISARTILPGQTTDKEFLDFIREQVEGIEIYERAFVPGVIYASNKPWKIVGNLNGLMGILSAALAFYLAFKPEASKDIEPQIIVKIENAGQNNVFHLGEGAKTEQELVKQLTDSLKLLKMQLDLQKTRGYI